MENIWMPDRSVDSCSLKPLSHVIPLWHEKKCAKTLGEASFYLDGGRGAVFCPVPKFLWWISYSARFKDNVLAQQLILIRETNTQLDCESRLLPPIFTFLDIQWPLVAIVTFTSVKGGSQEKKYKSLYREEVRHGRLGQQTAVSWVKVKVNGEFF